MFNQLFARLGGVGAFPKPLQQRDFKPLLELVHLMRDGGLTQVQGLCRSGKAAPVGYFDVGPELIEIKPAHEDKARLSVAQTIILASTWFHKILAEQERLKPAFSYCVLDRVGNSILQRNPAGILLLGFGRNRRNPHGQLWVLL